MWIGEAEESEPCLLQIFYEYEYNEYNAKNIVKKNDCFKNVLNISCSDLFITSTPCNFQNTIAVSNKLSDFHKILITVTKM